MRSGSEEFAIALRREYRRLETKRQVQAFARRWSLFFAISFALACSLIFLLLDWIRIR